MEFFKNIKLEKVSENEYEIVFKITDVLTQNLKVTKDQLEHIISCYRQTK